MECRAEGILLSVEDLTERPVKRTLLKKLQENFLPMREDTWGLRARLELDTTMLCFRWKELKKEQQDAILESEDYFAEEKINGVRAVVTYHPDEGFRVFSRHLSVQDFLPVEYTKKILLPVISNTPYPISFVLDCEIQSRNPNVTVGKETTDSQLNATVAILNAKPEVAQRVQLEGQTELMIHVFDVMSSNNVDLMKDPWYVRTETRRSLFKKCFSRMHSSFVYVKGSSEIIKLYREVTESQRGEGVVIKDMYAPYYNSDSRTHRSWIKMKRSMMESLVTDIDAFIIGSVPSTKGKRHEGVIGGVKLGVYLDDEARSVHHIATVQNMPDSWKDKLTSEATKGTDEPFMDHKFLGKVVAVDGMSVSSKSLRLTHAVVDWARGFRIDKVSSECEMSLETLESHVM